MKEAYDSEWNMISELPARAVFGPDPAFWNISSFASIFDPLKTATAKPFARSTKIMITAGPSSLDRLQELIDLGVDCIRFNMCYSLEEHQKFLDTLRSCKGNERVCLVADLQGRGIRTGRLENDQPIRLKKGDKFSLWTDWSRIGNQDGVAISNPEIMEMARVGDKVYLGNGAVMLEVDSISRNEIAGSVLVDGDLENNKGVQVSGQRVPGEAVSAKDRIDIEWAVQSGFDYIALSMIQEPTDVESLRSVVADRGPRIIAKIETRYALQHADNLIAAADVVQISRGDLAVNVAAKELTAIQKNLIRRCNVAGKPCVLASQILSTMCVNPRPTRAECTDAINAVFDGADCMLMTNETATGQYPIEAFKQMQTLVTQADCFRKSFDTSHGTDPLMEVVRSAKVTVEEAVAAAAVNFSRDLKAPAALIMTETGHTALFMTKYRPSCPIFCCTPKYVTARRMGIVKGCHPIVYDEKLGEQEALAYSLMFVKEHQAVAKGDTVVVTLGSKFRRAGATDMMHCIRVN